MSPNKWIANINAIVIISKSGRYGGNFANSDIAFEFASWISAEFKLYFRKGISGNLESYEAPPNEMMTKTYSI
jgi:hypothetical protein